jgi:hypothetical protein
MSTAIQFALLYCYVCGMSLLSDASYFGRLAIIAIVAVEFVIGLLERLDQSAMASNCSHRKSIVVAGI